MKIRIALIFLAVILFKQTSFANTTSSVDDGKAIFSIRCAACHNVNVKVIGPALADVDKRHNIDWIINFVHSSQTLVKKNDKDAVALFNEFNSTVMPDHPDLSEEQIKSVVDYIKSQTKSANSDAAPFARPGRLQPDYIPVSITNIGFFGPYIALVFLMIASIIIAVRVKELQRENKKDTQEIY